MICKCPLGEALTAIPEFNCPEYFGQIQKVAFQRIFDTKGQLNAFDSQAEPPADVKLLASWTTKISAMDATKVVLSPYIQAPTSEAGAPRTFGGGNETLGGIEQIIGREPQPFTAVIRNAPQDVIKALKELQCEQIGVYLFNENGQIGCIKDAESETKFLPIPVSSLFVGDKTFGGIEAPDGNTIQWSFMPNWSDDFAVVSPSFNPLALKAE